MKTRKTIFVILIMALVSLFSLAAGSAQEATEEAPPQATITQENLTPADGSVATPAPGETTQSEISIPDEIAVHDEDWPLAHKNYANTRAVFNSNINSETVSELEVSWTFPIPGRASFGAAASAPIVVANTVYFQDLESNVFALDLDTGQVLWERMYNNSVVGPNGPGIGYGKVFVISGVDRFAALDAETGTEVWSRDSAGRPTGAFQPYVFNNLVYYTTQAGVGGDGDVSYRGYAGGTSGHIMALNPETGETVWDFQTVEEGFWGNPELNSGGGVWFSPAVDTQTGLTFWGTGNPAPFPGTFEYPNASSREEPNLYTNSLVALASTTGEMAWYNYVNPNDLFDLDFQISPILATVLDEGQQRDIVIGSGKLGEIIAFDRATGEIIWRTPVGIHQNDDLTEIPPGETVVVYPGILGGVETPMAFANNVVYAPVLNLPTEHSPTGWGATNGTEALEGADSHTATGQGTSELVAVDATTGQVLWSHEFNTGMYGGATVVSDLVFTATFDGMIYALDRATGETVWSYQAPAGINAWPAVVGDMIIWPAGFGDNPSLIALRLPVDAIGGVEVTAEATAETTPETEATAEATAEPAPEEDGDEQAEATAESTAEAEATAEATAESTAEATEEAGEGAAQGETQSEFISVDAENQTVTLTVIASYDSSNGGLNFNGYSNGAATYVVPEGWTVNVEFTNEAQLPHSAMIVPQDAVDQQQMPEPVFEGASISDPTSGITGSESFSFTAAEQGTYALACGVPSHAASGHWIVFEVGGSDAQPSFQTGG